MRRTWQRNATVFCLLAVAALAGCSGPATEAPAPFAQNDEDQEDFILVLAIDLSGSFLPLMTEDGRAYNFMLDVLDKYLRDQIGANAKVIVVQLSNPRTKPLLWEGSPLDLRGEFPDAGAFRSFLLSKSDPNGSRIHDGLVDVLDYVMGKPGVMSGRTRSVLLCLSDFEDNAGDEAGSEQRLLLSLGKYAKTKGAVGFYFVEQTLVNKWKHHMQQAGIKHFIVEPEIKTPTLPQLQ